MRIFLIVCYFRIFPHSTTRMITHYLKLAWRNLRSQKLISTINILSLALGVAACLAILLFIRDEESFDTFHPEVDQLYRLAEIQSFPGTNTQQVALSMPGMGPNLHADYPEIESYTRYFNHGRQLVRHEDQYQVLENTVAVDSTFLELFHYPLRYGDPSSALDDAQGVIVKPSTAQALFGREDVVGETLELMGEPYRITGVLEGVPENTHLQFDLLFSLVSYTSEDAGFNQQFGSNYLVTYLRMNPGTDIRALEAKMPDFLLRYMPPDEGETGNVNDYYKLFFQSLPDVHLASMQVEHDYQNYRKFDRSYLQIFRMVGIFILLIAAFNFMNLMMARAAHRWKEVGVRNTVGARRGQLFQQFLTESLLFGLLAFALGLVLLQLFLPLLSQAIDRPLSTAYFIEHPLFLFFALGVTVILGLLAGIYPSFVLASQDTANILQGGQVRPGRSSFRSGLIVLQFGLAVAMIVSTLVVMRQLYFMQQTDIGFDREHVLLVDMNQRANEAFPQIKERFRQEASVLGVTASGQRLGNNFHQWGFKIRTDTVKGLTPSNVNVDYDYLDVYGIEVLAGRGFSADRPQDNGRAFVINRSLAEELGLEDPIGVQAGHSWYEDDSLGTIIGVVEDFHYNSLHYAINTLAMVVHPEWGYEEMSVKISGENIPATINRLEKIWTEMVPDWPFQYAFLDDHFKTLYRTDQQMKAVVSIMAALAILIACMGLFGLAAITTQRRIKEIGVRKILGASTLQILITISGKFVRLILLAFLLFSPVAWYFLQVWLEGFAYRIDLNIWMFLIGGAMALLIALMTLSFHALRSARANPVEALRYE